MLYIGQIHLYVLIILLRVVAGILFITAIMDVLALQIPNRILCLLSTMVAIYIIALWEGLYRTSSSSHLVALVTSDKYSLTGVIAMVVAVVVPRD